MSLILRRRVTLFGTSLLTTIKGLTNLGTFTIVSKSGLLRTSDLDEFQTIYKKDGSVDLLLVTCPLVVPPASLGTQSALDDLTH